MYHPFHRLINHVFPLCCMLALAGCYSPDRPNNAVLSPQTVLANTDQLLNRMITVRGTATPSLRMLCTLMACSAENPCCNTCGAELQLCESGSCITVSGDEAGIQVGCSGNDCGVTCSPFLQGTVQQVSGVWRKRAYGEYVLELRSVSQRACFNTIGRHKNINQREYHAF